MRLLILLLFLSFPRIGKAQSLEFIGLKDVAFGMSESAFANKVLKMDSTTSYNDTAFYLNTTRCHNYYRTNETLQLKGFTAGSIEYQFCDGKLQYVFISVSGKEETDKALNELQKTFTKLNCKEDKTGRNCQLMDSHAAHMRIIVRKNKAGDQMNFVLIPR